MIRLILSILGFLSLSVIVWGQSDSISEVSFDYDAAGNRVKREIIYYESQQKSASKITDEGDVEFEAGLNVYPNPAKECIYVTLNQEALESPNRIIMLFDNTGRLVRQEAVYNEINQVSVSELTNGIYILKLVYGKKTKVWTIIKN